MKLVRLMLPILLVGLSINSAAETDAVALDPAQEHFFSQFRTAVHGEDTRQLLKLTHPQARACTSPEDQEYYYTLILKGLVKMLGHQQIIKEIKSQQIKEKDLEPLSGSTAKAGMRWPIPPEEKLIVKYVLDGTENTASIYIARDQDQWKWVHVCY